MDLRKYIGDTIPLEQMHSIFRINQVDVEVATLYRDIILSVLDTVFVTYLGDELTNEDDQRKHFIWAWEDTKMKYSSEGFTLKDDLELRDYFYTFIADVYYDSPDKDTIIENNLKKLWYYLFNPTKEKSQSDIDVFIEIYDMFTKSIF